MSEVPPPEVFLQADFDGSSLKVAQLRGILLQCDISLPATAKKADLVKAFEEQVQPRGSTILSTSSRVKASDKGIVSVPNDGTKSISSRQGVKRGRGRPKKQEQMLTSESEDIEAVEEPPKRPRGRPRKTPASRATTKERSIEVEIPIVKRSRSRKVDDTPTPQKSRRTTSVATVTPVPEIPSAPSSSRRAGHSTASVVSEMPTLLEAPAVTKTPRSASKRKSEAVKMEQVQESEAEEIMDTPLQSPKRQKTPRRSEPRRSEESGFSDYNPFQSGSEEAAERERRRRKSSVGLTAKKPGKPRMSEPPPRQETHTPGTLRWVGPSRENLRTPTSAIKRDTPLGNRDAMDELDAAEAYNQAISEKLAQMSPQGQREQPPKIKITSHVTPRESSSQAIQRYMSDIPTAMTKQGTVIPLSMLFLLLLSFLASWKSQSQSIGYCDPGASINHIIVNRQSAIEDANACVAQRTKQALDNPSVPPAIECDVSALPLVPFLPRPTSCTPCPQHAICEDGRILACEPEYLLTQSLFEFASPALDGLPIVGPRGFPPSCKPDTARKRMVGSLAKQMERDLAKGRGHVMCAGLGKDDGRQGQGQRYGMAEDTLRTRYLSRKDPKFSREQFEEIFEAALADLVEHDDVIESIDVNGKSWYAAARTDLTLSCKAKMEAYSLLDQWRRQLASSAAVLAAIAYLRSTMKHRKAEQYQAEELMQVVLKRLQDQESLHYTDPVTTPNPFIPPNQLRDVVIPPSGSSAHRTRLWQRVQDLVAANANVLVREREMRGEIWKTWEWAGVGERHVTFE